MSRKLIRHGAAIVVLALTVVMSVCADDLNEILERGTMRVAVSEYAPWCMRAADGGLVGFEIDVANKIAADMGVTAEFEVYDWDRLIPALREGEVDVIIAGMSITPGRALKVDFTRPYAESGTTLVTHTENTRDIDSLESLNAAGITIGAVAETTNADLVRRLFDKARMRSYGASGEAEKALLAGELDAYVTTVPEARFLVLANPSVVDLPLAKPLLTAKEGIAVRRGEHAWRNFLDAWIVARDADEWIPTAHEYWFNSLEWTDRVQTPPQ